MFKMILMIACLSLASCQGISIEQADNRLFDQKKNGSYAWLREPLIKSSARHDNLYLLDSVLRNELEAQMAAKGYRLIPEGEVDFLVSYSFTREMIVDYEKSRQKVMAENDRWMTTVSFDDGQHSQISETAEKANLQVSFEDKSGTVIWNAIASKAIENKYAEEDQYQKVIKQVITRMFTHLPAKEN